MLDIEGQAHSRLLNSESSYASVNRARRQTEVSPKACSVENEGMSYRDYKVITDRLL